MDAEKKTFDPLASPRTVVEEMMRTMRMHREIIRHIVHRTGIHPTHHDFLMHLSKDESTFRQQELASRFGITPAAVVQNLDRMEEAGYVRREASESDSRCKRILITEKGRQIVEESAEEFGKLDAKLLEGIEGEDLETFLRVLQKMQENITPSLAEKESGEG